MIVAIDRRLAALDMRRQGQTYRQIAAALGLANPGNAHRMVSDELAALREQCSESTANLRDIELERLDLLWRSLMPAVERGDARAVLGCVAISKRRAVLLGLDAPRQVALSGTVKTYAVRDASPDCPAWPALPPHDIGDTST